MNTQNSSSGQFFIVGGAGFIGSHFIDRLLADHSVTKLTVYDNFSSGREWHYLAHLSDQGLRVVRGEVQDLDPLTAARQGHGVVMRLASNPDIARAAKEPDIDFRQGTYLTNNVLEAMRRSGVTRILYASGSGIYGDLGNQEAHENYGPLIPISTYGASKLAGEALISDACHMFDFRGRIFRFGNVVGPRHTHGVGFDFLRQLLANPCKLRILGDGTQSKSYIHVRDVVEAVLMAAGNWKPAFAAYNVATGDYITVTEIANLAVECAGLKPGQIEFEYTGGHRGWKGDMVAAVRQKFPSAQVLGIELSHSGVEVSRQKVSGAQFVQRNLLDGSAPPKEQQGWATHAVCSEVIEHVDDPCKLLASALQYMGVGCKLVITAPGGPMSAFDKHIGHRKHYRIDEIESLFRAAGYEPDRLTRAGFPFFNLYRSLVVLR